MKVIRATAMGMCFGVRDALQEMRQIVDPHQTTIHGELVHNPRVLVQLDELGFHTLAESDRERMPETDTVVITAHGVSHRERSRLTAAGKNLIDTTCPLVRQVHEAAQELKNEGRHVLVIGRPGHVEVQGIVEDLLSYDVIASHNDVRSWPYQMLGIVCQSTTPPHVAEELGGLIHRENPHADIRVIDTICHPTRDRQQAVVDLCDRVDGVVVVGGRNSNNTQQLVQVAREHGTHAWSVETAEELRGEWFTGYETIGLTAGTSTLDETIDEVEQALRTINRGAGPSSRESDASLHQTPIPPQGPSTSTDWTAYFTQNLAQDRIDWTLPATLSPSTHRKLIRSLQAWQLGETSDGNHLLRASAKYAEQMNDPEFIAAMKLFIREEQKHGECLGKYLDRIGAKRLTFDLGDWMFRRVRGILTNMEVWTVTVIVVESFAQMYYGVLARTSGCPLLRAICTDILHDEVQHIRFQLQRLTEIHRRRGRAMRFLAGVAYRTLFEGIAAAVWVGHRRVFRAGGLTYRGYRRRAVVKYERIRRLMRRDHPSQDHGN